MKSAVHFQSVTVSPGRNTTPHQKTTQAVGIPPPIGLYYRCHPLKPLLKAGRAGFFMF
jgi:hypothetical protein